MGSRATALGLLGGTLALAALYAVFNLSLLELLPGLAAGGIGAYLGHRLQGDSPQQRRRRRRVLLRLCAAMVIIFLVNVMLAVLESR